MAAEALAKEGCPDALRRSIAKEVFLRERYVALDPTLCDDLLITTREGRCAHCLLGGPKAGPAVRELWLG